jgi:hypothetical protein
MAEDDKPSIENVNKNAEQTKVNGAKMDSNVESDTNVEKMSTKTTVSVVDVLKSTNLDDAGKFDLFRGLVEGGKLTNKEVVNSILHLVRKQKKNSFTEVFKL